MSQLVKDYESDAEVNKQLDKMYCIHKHCMVRLRVVNACSTHRGYNIGVRLIEDLLARSNVGRCHDFRETADVIAKVSYQLDSTVLSTTLFKKVCLSVLAQIGFKTYLGVTPIIANWSGAFDEFSLILDHNPLAEFVEIPDDHKKLFYSNILCGVLRGALEMVSK